MAAPSMIARTTHTAIATHTRMGTDAQIMTAPTSRTATDHSHSHSHAHAHGHGCTDHDCSDQSHSHGLSHVHDQTVGSIGFTLEPHQQIHLFRLRNFISQLIQTHNEDLYRYKGVIAVKGYEEKYIFQGVHMLF